MGDQSVEIAEAVDLCVYVSSATELFGDDDLRDLLTVSRKNNAEHGITGVLLYADGCFLQAFEGSRTEVERLRAILKKDPRHRGMLELMRRTVPERIFGAWTMGFHRSTLERLGEIEGVSRYLATGQLEDPIEDRQVLLLLNSFRQTNSPVLNL